MATEVLNEDGNFTWAGRRWLLNTELMSLPLSVWMKYPKNDAETTFDFIHNHTNFGHISVRCEDEFGEKAGLYVEGQRLSGANKLYRRLTGDWTWRMRRKFSQQLRMADSSWERVFGANVYKTKYDEDTVRLTCSLEGNKRIYRVFVNGLEIKGNWRRLCLHVSSVYLHQLFTAAWQRAESQERLRRRR